MTSKRRQWINLSESIRDLDLDATQKARFAERVADAIEMVPVGDDPQSTVDPTFNRERFLAHATSATSEKPSYEDGDWVRYVDGDRVPAFG